MALIALTRAVSPSLARCELTHVGREPIDADRAVAEHGAYEECLRSLGCDVRRLPPQPDLPDAVFVEDTAVVFDELAVVARPGASSRRAEASSVADALAAYRPLRLIEPPATLDGGDVLAVGRRVFVGLSTRTNEAGVAQLRAALAPHGYAVRAVAVRSCLHLKSAATRVGSAAVLLNPAWVDPSVFDGLEVIETHPQEELGANALAVGSAVIYASAFPRTRERLEGRGIRVHALDVSELAKAEGGVTCCSLVLETSP